MTGQGRVVAFALALAASASIVVAQVGSVAHFAGGQGAVGHVDGNSWDARFFGATSVALDGSGTVYVACSDGSVRAVASGSVSTVTYSANADAIAHASGNLYALIGSSVQKVTLPGGGVSLFAGSTSTSGSTNGALLDARFNNPRGIAADAAGTNLFVADTFNYTIRKVPLTGGATTTLAGSPLQSGAVNATGSSARFRFPTALAIDPTTGDVLVGDDTMVRRVTQGGVVSTIAGVDGVHLLVDGTLSAARFVSIRGIAVSSAGAIFVSDAGRIRKIAAGVVSTFSGTDIGPGSFYYAGIDGDAGMTTYFAPQGLAVDASGQVYVADWNAVRRTDTFGNITTIAGPSAYAGWRDGFPIEARFFYPEGIAYHAASSTFFVTDTYFGNIRRILPSGYVTTLTDGTGTPLYFDRIRRIAIDQTTGTLHVTTGRHIVQKVTQAGVVTTLAGSSGATGSTDASGSSARFNSPADITVDSSGNIYVADTGNHTIRRITPVGVVSTLAGLAGASGTVDATGSAARFNQPSGITFDPFSGALYVADFTAIRKVTLSGVVTTFAGSGTSNGTVDGTGAAASFWNPRDVEADSLGNLYVTEKLALRIVSSARAVKTLAGPGSGSRDGIGSAAEFGSASAVAFDASKNRLLIADSPNHNLREGFNSVIFSARIDLPSGPAGLTRYLNAHPDTASTYTWSVSQRPAGSTATFPFNGAPQANFTPDAEGSYVFTLSASSPQGSSTSSVPFTSCSAGSVTITAPQTPTCPGATATASVPDQGPNAVYSWRITGGRIVSGAGTRSIQFTPDASGVNHGIDINVVLANGCTLTGGGFIDVDIPGISSNKRSYSAAEHIVFVGIGFFQSCAWTATSASPWITFTTPTSGSGLGFVRYKIAANTSGARREGSVTIAGVKIPITQSALDAPLTVNFFAGPTGGADSRDGNGTSARFVGPDSIASDASGNLYVFDDFTIRKISPAGAVTTLAGLSGIGGDIDGTRGKARFNGSGGPIVAAPNGTLYVDDFFLKRITAGGTVSLFADSRTNPSMLRPMCTDASGNLYAQGPDAKIVKITPAGAVSTWVQLPYTIVAAAIDASGNLYVVQQYGTGIEKVTPSGTITPFAGTGGCSATDLCYGIAALAADGSGNFFASSGSRIYRITAAGAITLLAGTGAQGYSDGTGATAVFHYPEGIAASGGNVYAAESWNHCIRKVDASNNVSTFAGLGIVYGSTDGTGAASRFNGIAAGATDSSGNLYVTDGRNHTIRKITPAGVVSVFAGATGQPGSTNANGTSAKFNYPAGIAIDRAAGIVYVADTANYTIRKITMTRDVTTFAGMVGSPGLTNATGTSAQFLSPSALTIDESTGDLYVVDDSAIRRVTKAGVVTTIKSGLVANYGSHVMRIAFDPVSKKLFYANQMLFMLSLDGTLTPFAGQPNGYLPIDGTGSSAQFSEGIRNLAADGHGNLYSTECIGDCTQSNLLRRITSTADVTTVAGDPNRPRVRYGGMSVEGTGDAVRFNYAGAFAFDNSRKRIYILDYGANVRIATPAIPDTATVDYPVGVLGIASRLDVQPRSATSWSWSIIRRPTGSTANLSATNVANPTFTPDVADRYVFRVVATGANGGRISDVTLDAISCTFALSAASGSSPAFGTSGSFSVTTQSACPWKAVSNVPWITVTPAAFTVAGGTVNYTVSATPLCSSRVGTITVANQTFTINQAAASTYIAPTSQNIAADGGPISVRISTGASCPWTATSNASWITITSGAAGSGSAYVNLRVASNNVTGARTGTVTLAGKTFTVNQVGVDGGKVFALVNYFFGSGAEPPGSECNGDNVVTTADLFCLINYLFANGPAPTAP